jgi:hypothetical protein
MTNHDDPIYGTEGLCDPSDEIVEVLLKANDLNMLSRRRCLSVDQVVELDTLAKEFLTALKQTFPERTGTTDAKGNLIGWRTEKIHSLLHNGRNILWFGCSDVTSAQGPERGHKNIVKKIGHLHNNKDIFLSLMRFHAKASQVQYLKQSLELNDVDSDGMSGLNLREIKDKNVSVPCELGIRYPVLQAAIDRSQVIIEAKVSFLCLLSVFICLAIVFLVSSYDFLLSFVGLWEKR